MKLLLSIILSYIVGSIPTAYIFGKILKGIDIRNYGSGNVGATNIFRVIGKWSGIAVLFLDILKGLLPVIVLSGIFAFDKIIYLIIIGIFVVVGHNWTIFLKFKGGKGIATSLGVLIGLTIKVSTVRPVLLLVLAIWIIAFIVSGFVSLSSIIAAVSLAIFMCVTNQSIELICLGVIICIFVVIRHRPNIKRLLSGQEPKVKLKLFKRK